MSVVVCLSSITECIVAKRCVLEQKLLLRAYRKSYMRNRFVLKWMTFILFGGRLRSREPFRLIRHWISWKPSVIKASFQRTANKKWPMGNPMVMWPMTSRDPEWSSRDPNTLRGQYLENSWRCFLSATAWLLVIFEIWDALKAWNIER